MEIDHVQDLNVESGVDNNGLRERGICHWGLLNLLSFSALHWSAPFVSVWSAALCCHIVSIY